MGGRPGGTLRYPGRTVPGMSRGAFGAGASIAAGRHGVFTRKEAATSGFGPREIATAKARGYVREPSPGVLVIAGSPDTWRQRLAVCIEAGKGRAAASHRACVVLHGLDGLDDPDAGGRVDEQLPANVERLGPVVPPPKLDVQVLQPYWFDLPAGYDGAVHQAKSLDLDADTVVIDGLRCTHLARTLCDLGAVWGDEQVWRALISARREHDLSPRWLSVTAAELERSGPSGAGTIRRLLRRWAGEGVLPESWLEELMGTLRQPGFPPLVRQHRVRGRDGRVIARVDAAMPDIKLAFEGHSRRFHFGPIREAADEDRDLALQAVGFEVVYLGWYAALSPAAVLDKIRPVIEERRRLHGGAA